MHEVCLRLSQDDLLRALLLSHELGEGDAQLVPLLALSLKQLLELGKLGLCLPQLEQCFAVVELQSALLLCQPRQGVLQLLHAALRSPLQVCILRRELLVFLS